MVLVGVHVSIAGSIASSVVRAVNSGCDVFQIFSRNPRGWNEKPLLSEEIVQFQNEFKNSKLQIAFVHMPYLPNLASPRLEVYEKSVESLGIEVRRCSALRIPYIVTHLGHHLGDGIEKGQKRVSEAINLVLDNDTSDVQILLENTAGEKNSVGSSFGDIRVVIDGINKAERIGICFDTCHAFGAGYDLKRDGGIDDVLADFEKIIGTKRIKLIHLNDSKGDLGSGLDRHEHIGLGMIGEPGFRNILKNPFIRSLPLVCETPVDARRDDRGNIQKVHELAQISPVQ